MIDNSAQAQMAASTLMAARTAAKTLSEEEIQALIEKWKEPPSWLKEYEAAPDRKPSSRNCASASLRVSH